MKSPKDTVHKLSHVFINDRPLTCSDKTMMLSEEELRVVITDKDVKETMHNVMEYLILQQSIDNKYHCRNKIIILLRLNK